MSSYKSKEAATTAAKNTIKKMKFGKWKMRVHENLGWHCSISWGNFSISIYNRTKFSKYMLLIGYGGCGISSLKAYHGDEPNKLITDCLQPSIDHLKYYTDVSDFLKEVQRSIRTGTPAKNPRTKEIRIWLYQNSLSGNANGHFDMLELPIESTEQDVINHAKPYYHRVFNVIDLGVFSSPIGNREFVADNVGVNLIKKPAKKKRP